MTEPRHYLAHFGPIANGAPPQMLGAAAALYSDPARYDRVRDLFDGARFSARQSQSREQVVHRLFPLPGLAQLVLFAIHQNDADRLRITGTEPSMRDRLRSGLDRARLGRTVSSINSTHAGHSWRVVEPRLRDHAERVLDIDQNRLRQYTERLVEDTTVPTVTAAYRAMKQTLAAAAALMATTRRPPSEILTGLAGAIEKVADTHGKLLTPHASFPARQGTPLLLLGDAEVREKGLAELVAQTGQLGDNLAAGLTRLRDLHLGTPAEVAHLDLVEKLLGSTLESVDELGKAPFSPAPRMLLGDRAALVISKVEETAGHLRAGPVDFPTYTAQSAIPLGTVRRAMTFSGNESTRPPRDLTPSEAADVRFFGEGRHPESPRARR